MRVHASDEGIHKQYKPNRFDESLTRVLERLQGHERHSMEFIHQPTILYMTQDGRRHARHEALHTWGMDARERGMFVLHAFNGG